MGIDRVLLDDLLFDKITYICQIIQRVVGHIIIIINYKVTCEGCRVLEKLKKAKKKLKYIYENWEVVRIEEIIDFFLIYNNRRHYNITVVVFKLLNYSKYNSMVEFKVRMVHKLYQKISYSINI